MRCTAVITPESRFPNCCSRAFACESRRSTTEAGLPSPYRFASRRADGRADRAGRARTPPLFFFHFPPPSWTKRGEATLRRSHTVYRTSRRRMGSVTQGLTQVDALPSPLYSTHAMPLETRWLSRYNELSPPGVITFLSRSLRRTCVPGDTRCIMQKGYENMVMVR